MSRKIMVAVLATTMSIALVAAAPVDNQRLAALEAKVADLTARVEALEAWAFPSTTPAPATPTPSATASTPTPSTTASPSPTATPAPTPTTTPTLAPSPSPTASTAPCGTSLQVRIDATVTGGSLNLGSCSYTTTSVTIAKAMTMTGGKLTGRLLIRNAFDVTVDGLEVTGGNTPAQQGAVDVDDGGRITLKNLNVHNAPGACVSMARVATALVQDSLLSACGQEGYHGDGGSNITYRGNEIRWNNTSLAPPCTDSRSECVNGRWQSGWEAGGGKQTKVQTALYENNISYGNGGPGLWCDIDCKNVTYRFNRAYDNTQGIFFEISDGAEIHDNVTYRNGGTTPEWCYRAGIIVSSSKNANVHDNVSAWDNRGITFLSQNRGGAWNDTSGNRAANNTVISSTGRRMMNWCQDWSGNLFTTGNNGAGGRYWAAQSEPQFERFEWATPLDTVAKFNNSPGDEGGRYLTTAEKDSILAAKGLPATP